MKINVGQKEIIHFTGIGGIGMSGLAQVMKVMGFKVQGSDININKNVENCKKLGIKFYIGQIYEFHQIYLVVLLHPNFYQLQHLSHHFFY